MQIGEWAGKRGVGRGDGKGSCGTKQVKTKLQYIQ